MSRLIGISTAGVLFALGLLHVYWAGEAPGTTGRALASFLAVSTRDPRSAASLG